MSQYTYIQSEPGLWTVGIRHDDSTWAPESDHSSAEEAAARVAWLNGGPDGDLTRLIVNITPQAATALDQAADRCGDTRTDTVGRALIVYDLITSGGPAGRYAMVGRDLHVWPGDDDRQLGRVLTGLAYCGLAAVVLLIVLIAAAILFGRHSGQ